MICTVLFTDYDYDKVDKLYDWYKDFSNFKIIHDISNIEPIKLKKQTNKNIMSVELNNLNSNLDVYYSNVLDWFNDNEYEYYNLINSDVILLGKEFEKRSIAYMKTHNIHVLFPIIKNKYSDPNNQFAKAYKRIKPKAWTLLKNIVIHRDALLNYRNSLSNTPRYLPEVMMPSVLLQESFHITANPFIDSNFFVGLEEFKKEQIKIAIKNKTLALHPIKDLNLLSFIREEYIKNKNLL